MTSTPLHDMQSVQRRTFIHWLIRLICAKEPIRRWACQPPANLTIPPPTVKPGAALAVASWEDVQQYSVCITHPYSIHFKAWLHPPSAVMNFKMLMIGAFMLPLTIEKHKWCQWRRNKLSTDIFFLLLTDLKLLWVLLKWKQTDDNSLIYASVDWVWIVSLRMNKPDMMWWDDEPRTK